MLRPVITAVTYAALAIAVSAPELAVSARGERGAAAPSRPVLALSVDAGAILAARVAAAPELAVRAQVAVIEAAGYLLKADFASPVARARVAYPHPAAGVGIVRPAIAARAGGVTFAAGLLEPIADALTGEAAVAASYVELAVTAAFSALITARPADAVVIADALAIDFGKALEDLVQPFDEAVLVVDWVRDFADAAEAADVATLDVGKALGESATASDAASFTIDAVYADSATPTDALAVDVGKVAEDSASATDAHSIEVGKDINLAGTFALNGLLLHGNIVHEGEQGDMVVTGDYLAFTVGAALADGASATEALAFDAGKVLTDTATATEAAAISVDKPLSDAASATESAAMDVGKAASDSVAPSDGAPVLDVGKVLTETATATDAAVMAVSAAAADSVTPSETASMDVGKVAAESATPTDALALAVGSVQADSVTPTDAAVMAAESVQSDSATPSDVATLDVGKSLADSATPTDEAAFAIGYGRELADSATPTDALAADVTKAASDSVTTSDVAALDVGKAAADSVAASDVADISVGFGREFAEAATPSDAAVFASEKTINLENTYALNGAPLHDAPMGASEYGDAIVTGDYAASDVGKVLADSAAPTDAIDSFAVGAALADSASPSDAITQVDATKVLSDSATPSDSFAYYIEIAPVVLDLLGPATSVLNGLILHGTEFYLHGAMLNDNDISDDVLPSDSIAISVAVGAPMLNEHVVHATQLN